VVVVLAGLVMMMASGRGVGGIVVLAYTGGSAVRREGTGGMWC